MTFPQQMVISLSTVVLSCVLSAILSYLVASRVQRRNREYLEEREHRQKEADERERRASSAPNDIQKRILLHCATIGEERFACQFHSGVVHINGTELLHESGGSYDSGLVETQLHEMARKGLIEILNAGQSAIVFEVTDFGKSFG